MNELTIVIVVLLIAVILLAIASKFLVPDKSSERKERLRKSSSSQLHKADKMLADGYLEQAIIQAHKAMEQVMRGLLNSQASSFDAISSLKSKGKLSKSGVDRAHKLRKKRNNAAHGETRLQEKDARTLISDARAVISELLR